MNLVVLVLAIILLILILLFTFSSSSTSVSTHKSQFKRQECDRHCDEDEEYDYIVVGAGTAGCVVAGQLARKGYNILLIERGLNRSNDPLITNALNALIPASSNIYSTTYLSEGMPYGAELIRLPVAAGRTVGGSSAVNYLVAVRPPKLFHDKLVELTGDDEFSYSNFLPIYENTESFIGVSQSPEDRGTSGPIAVTQLSGAGTEFSSWLSAVLGEEAKLDYNVGEDVVTSPYIQQTLTLDLQRSFAVNYIYENGELLPNITLLTDAQCQRVIFEGTRAVGVEIIRNNERVVHTAHKVVLSSGIESSCILERSGVGSENILGPLGINIVVPNDRVGEGLANHGGGYLVFLMGETYARQAFAPLFTHMPQTGVVDGYRNVEHLFLNTSYGVPVQGPTPVLTAAWNVNPQTRGSIHIVSASPQPPVINYNDREDIEIVARYIVEKVLPNTVDGVPEAEQVGPLLNAPPLVGTDEEKITTLADWLFGNQVPGQHYTGTCGIGHVVDSNLSVIGTQGLYVVDNSVYPTSVPGNTSLAAYAIGLYSISKLSPAD